MSCLLREAPHLDASYTDMEAVAKNNMFEESNLQLQISNSICTPNNSSPGISGVQSRTLYTWIHPSDCCAFLQKLDSCFVKIWMDVQPWIHLLLPPVTWHSQFEESSNHIFAAINWYSAARTPGTNHTQYWNLMVSLWFTLDFVCITTQVRLILHPAHRCGCMHVQTWTTTTTTTNDHNHELRGSVHHLHSFPNFDLSDLGGVTQDIFWRDLHLGYRLRLICT